ncbi:hypothetical protein JCM15765_04600 [Paradesulfitobacterium aromaticivorans]
MKNRISRSAKEHKNIEGNNLYLAGLPNSSVEFRKLGHLPIVPLYQELHNQ